MRDRLYKTFENFEDAKKHADYLSIHFTKFSDGYYSRENHHSSIPKLITNVIISVIHKDNENYYTQYWVTNYRNEDLIKEND
jgi:hypothetical protein